MIGALGINEQISIKKSNLMMLILLRFPLIKSDSTS